MRKFQIILITIIALGSFLVGCRNNHPDSRTSHAKSITNNEENVSLARSILYTWHSVDEALKNDNKTRKELKLQKTDLLNTKICLIKAYTSNKHLLIKSLRKLDATHLTNETYDSILIELKKSLLSSINSHEQFVTNLTSGDLSENQIILANKYIAEIEEVFQDIRNTTCRFLLDRKEKIFLSNSDKKSLTPDLESLFPNEMEKAKECIGNQDLLEFYFYNEHLSVAEGLCIALYVE